MLRHHGHIFSCLQRSRPNAPTAHVVQNCAAFVFSHQLSLPATGAEMRCNISENTDHFYRAKYYSTIKVLKSALFLPKVGT